MRPRVASYPVVVRTMPHDELELRNRWVAPPDPRPVLAYAYDAVEVNARGVDERDALRRFPRRLCEFFLREENGGRGRPPATILESIDLAALPAGARVVAVDAILPSPVSLALRQELQRSGRQHKRVALDMGVSPSVLSRLTDITYYGHSLESLERFATAVGKRLAITFEDAGEA